MVNYFSGSLLTFLFVVLQIVGVQAQRDIPKNIEELIDDLYPDAAQIQYESDGDDRTIYLLDNGEDVEIIFQENEGWFQITTYVSFENLPKAARGFIEEEYPDQKDYTTIIRVKTRTDTGYTVNFETDLKMINLTFDESGNLLEREVDDIDED
ncbi:MAG: hypothetical protein ACI85Q_001861 [Salibacteraceae bacterium]|jgi:hypothetical protein